MTGKSDFTPEEWETIAHAPPTAALIVITAQRGGVFRETLALTQSYAEARKQHGQSELLDEIVASRPALDHSGYHSAEELKAAGLQHLQTAVTLLRAKATDEEAEAYMQFVIDLATRVANAHREHGQSISESEQTALDEIGRALAAAAT